MDDIELDASWNFVGNPNDDTGTNDRWFIDDSESNPINSAYPYLKNIVPQ